MEWLAWGIALLATAWAIDTTIKNRQLRASAGIGADQFSIDNSAKLCVTELVEHYVADAEKEIGKRPPEEEIQRYADTMNGLCKYAIAVFCQFSAFVREREAAIGS